jgi:hypothetical protein
LSHPTKLDSASPTKHPVPGSFRDCILGRVDHPELTAQPRWRRTGNAFFPVVARVSGQWWVLRMNDFPDHPLWTLFVDGERRSDIDDTPPAWGKPSKTVTFLEANDASGALTPVRHFVAYDSEIGQPCDNPFCCGLRAISQAALDSVLALRTRP